MSLWDFIPVEELIKRNVPPYGLAPKKWRTVERTHIAAETHALRTGHEVTVYEECRTVIGAVVLDGEPGNAL